AGLDNADPENPGISQGLASVEAGLTGEIVPGLKQIRVALDRQFSPGLRDMKKGIDGQMVPGLGEILDGINKEIVPGMKVMRAGINGQMVPGLNQLAAGLSGDIAGGLVQIRGGLAEQVSPGLGDMLVGFNKTEAETGESGIVEGLTKISHGLANPEFTPNPGGDPGVSDGLGLVIDGIRTDVLGGVDELKSGITEKIMPGLEQMSTGISGELQPGFSKVSTLLLVIWLVSMVVLLVVGIFIGRGRKAKASTDRSASM
ncbi:MAG TPA: hypothetical protein PKL00_10525, partial [Bacillota bacterium]|nr:hypothetical protein [Bacillota bacterium]